MKIGIPKEIKNNESRVGMTPAGVAELIRHGHQVFVQHTAGINSGFSDEKYETVGAKILPDIASVYNEAEMIIKVKEPIEQEYKLIKQDQLVFTYFHFACDRQLTEAMIKTGAVCLAYETVETDDHKLPLLIPMSEVAGRMATLNGAYYLQKTKGGKGKLISGVPGVDRVKVLILGGGTVGEGFAGFFELDVVDANQAALPLDFAFGGFVGFVEFVEGDGGGVAVAGVVVDGGMRLEVSKFNAVDTGAVGSAELHQTGVSTDGEAGDVDCQSDALRVFLIEVGGVYADCDGAGGVLEHNRLVDVAGLVGTNHGAGDYD